jgi:hypothetical protein
MLNRRRFVYGIVSLSILGPGLVARARSTAVPNLRGPLSKEVFLALRDQTFTALVDRRRVRMRLVKVTDDAGDRDGKQFTVLFQGPADVPVGEGAYVMTHPTAGATTLYVQPGGSDDRFSYYKAPFNLLS